MQQWMWLALAVAGCATTSGATTAQHLTGYPYDVHDEGSRINGLVCGVSIDYTVERRGDTTTLSGFDGTHRPVYLEVREQGSGRRHITGTLGSATGTGEVDLVVTPTDLVGRAGVRTVQLAAAGDAYRGRMTVLNWQGSAPITVDGRGELLGLPAADAAALLPGMLNCEAPLGQPVVRADVAVRFGGPVGYESRAANEIR